jgi:hypothetical protein
MVLQSSFHRVNGVPQSACSVTHGDLAPASRTRRNGELGGAARPKVVPWSLLALLEEPVLRADGAMATFEGTRVCRADHTSLTRLSYW